MGYKHFSHRDDLVICSRTDFQRAQCAVCNDECTGLTYGCKECGFYIHYSCLLPQEISHPTHPTHSLFLKPVRTDFTCSTCRRSQSDGCCFLCQKPGCGFAIHVKCAFPLPAVAFPGHDHRLYFFDELPEDAEHRPCKVCSKPCRSWVLCCLDLKCKFGVHLACERPLCSFEHTVSRGVPPLLCCSEKFLELKASIDEVDVHGRLCSYCSKEMGPQTPLYYCDHCAFPLPAVAFPGHDHRLYFFDELPEDAEHRPCKVCSKPCRSWVLCCLDLNCKFGVHLACERPLCSFEHPVSRGVPPLLCCSEKFLELKASIDEVDVHGRLCSYCSKEMGPQTPLYYCDHCELIAHVNCIFSTADRDEDLTMIRAETKQDGRNEGNSETNEAAMQHVETFGKMVNSLDPKEESELENVYKRRVVEIIRVLAWRNNARGSSSDVPKSPFLDEAFLEFSKRLPHDIRRINSLAVASEGERVVQVAEYKMTKKLAPVLKELFASHGDLSEESNLKPKPKILVFVMLCGTIYSMDNTKVADVTEELLYNWWKYLMFIHLSRFEIKFAIDRLKVVMRAHYTNLHDDNNCLRIAVEIKELSEEIKVAQKKLDGLTEERKSMPDATDENLVEACSKNARAWKY